MACNTENIHVKTESMITHMLLHKPWDKIHYLQTERWGKSEARTSTPNDIITNRMWSCDFFVLIVAFDNFVHCMQRGLCIYLDRVCVILFIWGLSVRTSLFFVALWHINTHTTWVLTVRVRCFCTRGVEKEVRATRASLSFRRPSKWQLPPPSKSPTHLKMLVPLLFYRHTCKCPHIHWEIQA